MLKISKYKIQNYLLLLCCSLCATAYGIYGDNLSNNAPNIGHTSNNVASALFGVSNLWLAVATIAGIGFLFVGIVKYHEHRKNPQQTPIGTVFLMLFMAVALIGVAFIVQYGDSSYATIQSLFR